MKRVEGDRNAFPLTEPESVAAHVQASTTGSEVRVEAAHGDVDRTLVEEHPELRLFGGRLVVLRFDLHEAACRLELGIHRLVETTVDAHALAQ